MIVLIGSEKGGTGKSTTATNLAAMRAMAGKDVLLVDADNQQSSSLWQEVRSESGITPRITCVSKTGGQAAHDVVGMVPKFDDIIIDAGGRDSPQLRSFLVICEKHIIPVIPSQFDSWTLDTMDKLVRDANMQRGMVNVPTVKSMVICSKASPNPSLKEHHEVGEYVEQFPDSMEMGRVTLFDRVLFRKAVKEGKCVAEMAGPEDKAVWEISALYKDVFGEKFVPKAKK